MRRIAWVRVDLESSVKNDCRCIYIDFANSLVDGARREVCLDPYIPDRLVDVWMHKLGVVFVHDFFVDDAKVLGLLYEEPPERRKLHGEEDAQKYGCHHCD